MRTDSHSEVYIGHPTNSSSKAGDLVGEFDRCSYIEIAYIQARAYMANFLYRLQTAMAIEEIDEQGL